MAINIHTVHNESRRGEIKMECIDLVKVQIMIAYLQVGR